GRPRAGRHPGPRRLDGCGVAAGDPHRAGRVPGRHRSGRRRLHREPGAAGGNATGFGGFEYSLGGRWLEPLKQIAPGVTRAAVLRAPAMTAWIGQFGAIQALAPSVGVEVSPVNVPQALLARADEVIE